MTTHFEQRTRVDHLVDIYKSNCFYESLNTERNRQQTIDNFVATPASVTHILYMHRSRLLFSAAIKWPLNCRAPHVEPLSAADSISWSSIEFLYIFATLLRVFLATRNVQRVALSHHVFTAHNVVAHILRERL